MHVGFSIHLHLLHEYDIHYLPQCKVCVLIFDGNLNESLERSINKVKFYQHYYNNMNLKNFVEVSLPANTKRDYIKEAFNEKYREMLEELKD